MAGNPLESPRARRAWWSLTAGALVLGLTLAGCAGVGADPDALETEPQPTETPTAEPTPVETDAPVETDEPAETEAPEATDEPVDPRREVAVAVIGIEHIAGEGIEMRSFVAEYIGEGTCAYTAVDADGVEHVAEVAALPDAQSTVCPTTYLDVAPGVYEVVIEFSNDEVIGTSEPVVVEVDA